MFGRGFFSVLLVSLPLVACTGELTPIGGDGDGDGDVDAAGSPAQIVFNRDVQPTLAGAACIGCHIGAAAVGGTLFGMASGDEYQAILQTITPLGGMPLVMSPPENSVLVVYGDHTDRAGGRAFEQAEIDLITPWIQMEIDAGNVTGP